MLLRARKHHMVDFEGEMLFQRRDEDHNNYILRDLSGQEQYAASPPDRPGWPGGPGGPEKKFFYA
ncbi:hypothetical protein ANCDUO_02160 [Ancylostoma duodenale]|uniref:Costars domain-containing protein n=1 Tax=Ancylostoma duodenale TaxID=51022 RepID=A0A0C2H7H6_9BILA|nr:hypothetical protein ANCDUO_02160 [Ancylostoma duodenale]